MSCITRRVYTHACTVRSPARIRRTTPVRCSLSPPSVDWRYGNIQILFIDRTDTIRGRLAVGMFERISAWNGLTLSLISYQCGLDPIERREVLEFDKACALMSFATRWQFRPRLFTSPRQQFVPEDVDRFTLLVALDDSIEAEVLRQLSLFHPSDPTRYIHRVCSLSDFSYYCNDEKLLKPGGSGLLDRELRELLRKHLLTLRPAMAQQMSSVSAGGEIYSSVGGMAHIPSYLKPSIAPLSLQDPPETWDRTMMLLAVCLAGLQEYLVDCRPPPQGPDSPGYDTDA